MMEVLRLVYMLVWTHMVFGAPRLVSVQVASDNANPALAGGCNLVTVMVTGNEALQNVAIQYQPLSRALAVVGSGTTFNGRFLASINSQTQCSGDRMHGKYLDSTGMDGSHGGDRSLTHVTAMSLYCPGSTVRLDRGRLSHRGYSVR